MTEQPERIYLMMFSLVNVIGIISGMWWLPATAHLINAENSSSNIFITASRTSSGFLIFWLPYSACRFRFLVSPSGF